VVEGDVRNARALAEAMRGTDAVVSTLGLGKVKNPGNLIADSTRALVRAAEDSGTKRATFADKAAGERVLTASGLDWTLAYPVLPTDKPATNNVQAIDLTALDRLPGLPRISGADVAAFLLDAAVAGSWSRRTAVLTARR